MHGELIDFSNEGAPSSMSGAGNVDRRGGQGPSLFHCSICNVTVSSGLYAAFALYCMSEIKL